MSKTKIIAIPHRLKACVWLVDEESIEAFNQGNNDDEGLHDLSSWTTIKDGLTYQGHQKELVRRLAREESQVEAT